MGIFTNQAALHATTIVQANQHEHYSNTKRNIVELFVFNQKDILGELVQLLGENFVTEELIFSVDHLEFKEELKYTTVSIPVRPKGTNRSDVHTLLVFDTDPTHKRLLKTRSGRHSHIELGDEEHTGEDLRDILTYWDRFTN